MNIFCLLLRSAFVCFVFRWMYRGWYIFGSSFPFEKVRCFPFLREMILCGDENSKVEKSHPIFIVSTNYLLVLLTYFRDFLLNLIPKNNSIVWIRTTSIAVFVCVSWLDRKRKECQAPKTSTIPVDESQSSSTLSSWNWKESLLTRRNRKSSSLVVQTSNDTDGVDSEDISSIFPLSTLSAASLDSAGALSSFDTENTRAHRSERYAPLHASLSPHGDGTPIFLSCC